MSCCGPSTMALSASTPPIGFRPVPLRRPLPVGGFADAQAPADDPRRRTRPAALRRTVQSIEAGDLQGAERVRAGDNGAAAQPYVGSVFDQRGGFAPDRGDFGF